MRLRHYNCLRNFVVMARHASLASAAEELCLTKGALSHQIRSLETELGFVVFERHARGVYLSAKGKELLAISQRAFDQIEDKALELGDLKSHALTIGMTTYFASRWLSPRLMDFMRRYPDIRLRIQPMVDLLNLRGEGVSLAIRWGDSQWSDCEIERLFTCPAWPTGNRDAFERVQRDGLQSAFADFTLLHDRDGSAAWEEWYERAGLPPNHSADTLIIPDPNVRVQAVLDGQGVALNDELVADEIKSGRLFKLSPVELSDYGYFLAYERPATENPDVAAFIRWIKTVR